MLHLAKDASLSEPRIYSPRGIEQHNEAYISDNERILAEMGIQEQSKGRLPLQERCPVRNAYILQSG